MPLRLSFGGGVIKAGTRSIRENARRSQGGRSGREGKGGGEGGRDT